MKYIKQYEKVIAAKSEEAKRNPLYDFSGRLLPIVRTVAKGLIDPKFLIANRYIEDDDYITIRCQEKGTSVFFKITLDYDERLDRKGVTMTVRARPSFGIENFFNFISDQLDPYIVDRRLKDNYLRLSFSLEDTDDIVKKLEIFLIANKFNI
jgi:hypothetical protein